MRGTVSAGGYLRRCDRIRLAELRSARRCFGPLRACARVSLGKEESDVGSIEETLRRDPVGR